MDPNDEQNPTRRRALEAHTEEQREGLVRARQQHAEESERWNRQAALALYRILTEDIDGRMILDAETTEILAACNANVTDWNTANRWTHFRVDEDFTMRYEYRQGDRGRFTVIGWCASCGDILTYGHSIDTLAQLGGALEAEDKGITMHSCPTDEPVLPVYEPLRHLYEPAAVTDDDPGPAYMLLNAMEEWLNARLVALIPTPDNEF